MHVVRDAAGCQHRHFLVLEDTVQRNVVTGQGLVNTDMDVLVRLDTDLDEVVGSGDSLGSVLDRLELGVGAGETLLVLRTDLLRRREKERG